MEMKTELGTCQMGSATDSPCPFPAQEELYNGVLTLCAYHAATEPLAEESDALGVCAGLLSAYVKGARQHPAANALVEVLERALQDFTERKDLADRVLEDLLDAERRLMR